MICVLVSFGGDGRCNFELWMESNLAVGPASVFTPAPRHAQTCD